MNIKYKIIFVVVFYCFVSTGCRMQNNSPSKKSKEQTVSTSPNISEVQNKESSLEKFHPQSIKRIYFPILFEGVLNNKAIFRLRTINNQDCHTLSLGGQLVGYTLIDRDQDKATFESNRNKFIIYKNTPLIRFLEVKIVNEVTKKVHRIKLNQDFFHAGLRYKLVDVINRQIIIYDFKTKKVILLSPLGKKSK